MHQLLLGVGFGLVTSAILALSSVALSLQYSVTNVPNFAHGEILTVGAYGAFVAQQYTRSIPLEVLAAVSLGGAFAFGINRFVLRPFAARGAKGVTLFVLTIVVSFLVQNILQLIFGNNNVTFTLGVGRAHSVGPFLLTTQQEWVIMVAIMVMIALHIMLKYTRLGKAQRAVADSAELARISGVSAAKIVNLTWLIAGAVAGLGGFVLAATTGTFDSTLGFGFLLPTFAAVIIGGIGKPYGAMIGAVFIGVTMEVGALYIPPDYKQSLAFVLLILVLLIRPTGILGVVRQTSMGTA